MKGAYLALAAAAAQAGEDYETYKDNGYFSYVYAGKRDILSKAAERVKAAGDIGAELARLRADYAEYSRLAEEESVHPTFDWAGEHVWEMIYSGRADGARQAVAILEAYLNG